MFSVCDGVADDVWRYDRASKASECARKLKQSRVSIVYAKVIAHPLAFARGFARLTLQEDLQHSSRLFIDETRDTLYTTSSRQTTDSRLCYSLDVISQDLAVSLCAALAESLSACECRVSENVVVRRRGQTCLYRVQT